jgi:hypothetical protein
MTVGPLILALCLETGPQYSEACKVALEQGAVQSGIEGRAYEEKKRLEQSAIEYVNPPRSIQAVLGSAVYIIRLANGQEASFSVPNIFGVGATTMTVGKDVVGFGYRINF